VEKEMKYGEDYKFIPATSISSGVGIEVLPDLYCYTVQIVNLCMVGTADAEDFVVIDAGMPNSAEEIIRVTEKRYGNRQPRAIILTHGHFDHVGAILELIDYWNIPVYAHELEIPYLTGVKSYPEPDPSVEGGIIAKLAGLFPNEPIDLTDHVNPLPADGTVPFMPGFKWLHTPGHTDGHVSFFREKDRTLIVGDAFVTVKQDELYKVFTQQIEVNGPPRYFTPDWEASKKSVEELAKLNPVVAVTGHGQPVTGEKLKTGLKKLVDDFENIAVPDHGKYLN